MIGYWIRHRFVPSLLISSALAVIVGLLFVYPIVEQNANEYNNQSVYKNSDIDFIVPEPSFDQVNELSENEGIEKVFPFYMTKTEVKVNDKVRTTTVLLSDKFENVDFTMYNSKRIVKKSDSKFEKSILVDWQFCKETSAKIGDTVSFSISGSTEEYKIYAIYENNSIYDGGAILAEISVDTKNAIAEHSKNNGYSGMYVKSSDYNTCKSYLTSDYRPMGRLKDKAQFEDDDQYETHYHAIMDSSYANEITDFHVREKELDSETNNTLVYIGIVIILFMLVGFNILMSKRGCEKAYFIKKCIPVGRNVKTYYRYSFCFECIVAIIIYIATLYFRYSYSKDFISKSTIGIFILYIPIAIVAAEVFSLIINYSMLNNAYRKMSSDKKVIEDIK